MTPMVGCEVARPLLSEFVDGELPVSEQVLVEAHVRVCRDCAAHVEDLLVVGCGLRYAAPTTPAIDLDIMVGQISERVRAEQAMSWPVWFRQLREERRVVWALAGATCGVVLCALLTAAVVIGLEMQTANSLAAVMRVLASPGSDQNPLQLNAGMLPPRLTIPVYADDAPELSALEDDVVFAIAGTVTRQGKFRDYALLQEPARSEHEGHRLSGEAGDAFMERAVSRLRFAPAQAGGEPVAVNLVWVVARTTVRGSAGNVLPIPLPAVSRRPS